MFNNKNLYKIVYQIYARYSTIIAAKNETQALKKFYKHAKKQHYIIPDVISIQEVIA